MKGTSGQPNTKWAKEVRRREAAEQKRLKRLERRRGKGKQIVGAGASEGA